MQRGRVERSAHIERVQHHVSGPNSIRPGAAMRVCWHKTSRGSAFPRSLGSDAAALASAEFELRQARSLVGNGRRLKIEPTRPEETLHARRKHRIRSELGHKSSSMCEEIQSAAVVDQIQPRSMLKCHLKTRSTLFVGPSSRSLLLFAFLHYTTPTPPTHTTTVGSAWAWRPAG